ncbi:MAG TPA: molybdenum cofactor guanylyltransferase [Opitutaceae bacterium]
MKPGFSALLLAGGASTRMGRPKALLKFEGRPLWRRQAELLQKLGPAELMISAGNDWKVEPGPWTLVRDRLPGIGPLGGIAAAMDAMASDLLLVLAVDMPSMSAGYLGGLLEASGPGGVVPEENGFYHGLAAVYPRSVRALVAAALGGADHSLQPILTCAVRDGLIAARPIAAGEWQLFRNVNRPEDLLPQ